MRRPKDSCPDRDKHTDDPTEPDGYVAWKAGDRVLCRTSDGEWWETTAISGPRYDHAKALRGRCHLTVAVGPWGNLPSVNWPAEDVRKAEVSDVA